MSSISSRVRRGVGFLSRGRGKGWRQQPHAHGNPPTFFFAPLGRAHLKHDKSGVTPRPPCLGHGVEWVFFVPLFPMPRAAAARRGLGEAIFNRRREARKHSTSSSPAPPASFFNSISNPHLIYWTPEGLRKGHGRHKPYPGRRLSQNGRGGRALREVCSARRGGLGSRRTVRSGPSTLSTESRERGEGASQRGVQWGSRSSSSLVPAPLAAPDPCPRASFPPTRRPPRRREAVTRAPRLASSREILLSSPTNPSVCGQGSQVAGGPGLAPDPTHTHTLPHTPTHPDPRPSPVRPRPPDPFETLSIKVSPVA